jgi:hypothetical protein
MTHTIDTLMELAERMAVAMAGNPDACELIDARSELHAALTEVLGPETWTDDGGWTFEIEKPANPVGINGLTEAEASASMSVAGLSKPKPAQPVVKESLSTQVAQPVPPHEVNRANPASHDFGCHANAFGPCTCKAVQPVREPKNVSQNFRSFFQWANSSGYDTAHTCNSDTGEWIVFNPMTEDLWKCWQADHGIG